MMNRSPSILPPELIVLLRPTMSVVLAMSFLHVVAASITAAKQQQPLPTTLPGCPDKCGNISIHFPFGVNKPGCFLDGFQVTCNHSFEPPRLFLQFYPVNESEPTPSLFTNGINLPSDGSFHQMDTIREDYSEGHEDYPDSSETNRSVLPVELMDISVSQAKVRAYGMVRSSCSYSKANKTYKTHRLQRTTLLSPPFKLAEGRNVLVGVGQLLEAYLSSTVYHSSAKEFLKCDSDTFGIPQLAANGNCSVSGKGCCEVLVTGEIYDSPSFEVLLKPGISLDESYPCSYGMVVEKSMYNFSTKDMDGYDDVLPKKFARGVPFVIDFAIPYQYGSCPAAGAGGPPPPGYACRSSNSFCANATNGGYVCKCSENYQGNPYIPNGCQDIDECTALQEPCFSGATCVNKIGGYDCPCKSGMTGDGKHGACTEQFPLPAKIAVGAVAAILAASVCVFLVLLRKQKRRMKEYFDKNGGPMLEKISDIKILRKEQLNPILKSYNIVGKGFFGDVYKGLLDGVQVAVKKPRNINEQQKEQFANELSIQARILHKNILRLIGCCLEVDVPILVFEFISRGSLDDILHGDRKEPLDLDQRLSIAAGSAEGLAYMHSKTTTDTAVLHGDVKPANILLNDNLVPKISDFGISRLIAIDKAQHTEDVIGDESYMDPVYKNTGLLTEKSDVYSFGIVILELISRKRATCSSKKEEEATSASHNSFVMSFLDAHKTQCKTTELFDKEIITTARDIKLLECLAGIAVECLQYDVDQRPGMTDVAERLLMLKKSRDNKKVFVRAVTFPQHKQKYSEASIPSVTPIGRRIDVP